MKPSVYLTDSHGGGIFLHIDPLGECIACGVPAHSHSFADALHCENIEDADAYVEACDTPDNHLTDERREFLRKLYALHPESPGRSR